jgi:sugar (pentulose or hexulose) kinase
MAKAAPGFVSFIDVTSHEFYDGSFMIEKIRQYCVDTNQPVPQTIGEIARCVYESIAMSYREAFAGLEQLNGSRIDVLHIVGGGSNNKFLDQISANALNREVIAGPSEATAIGNLIVQMKASGVVKDLDVMNRVIRSSFGVESYFPQGAQEWTEQFERYLSIRKKYVEKKQV